MSDAPGRPDNNIGPKIVSPLQAVNVSKANGSSFPIQLTITNENTTTLNWTASVVAGWVKLDHTSGKNLAHNQEVTITATVNVSTFSVGLQSFELQLGFPSHILGVPEKTTTTTIPVNVVP